MLHIMSWMILFKKQLFDLEIKDQGPTKVIMVRDTPPFMVMHPHTKYHWPISKDKNVMARTRKYYLKNNYLTLIDLEVKVQGLTKVITVCDTPPFMVMHPHTWMILFKKQLFDLEVKGQGPTKVITARDTSPYGHAPTYLNDTI